MLQLSEDEENNEKSHTLSNLMDFLNFNIHFNFLHSIFLAAVKFDSLKNCQKKSKINEYTIDQKVRD